MKILEWMQKKLNGGYGKKKSNSNSTTYYMMHEPCKQEFSDWPQALLVIGTFGNNNLKEDSDSSNIAAGDSSSSQDCVQEFTLKAAGNVQNELNMYFREQVESNRVTDQINHRLNSEGKENETFSDDCNSNGGNFYPNSSLIHRLDNRKSVNGKKSLVFLLKNMFVCRSGFPPTPSFKDPPYTESRTLEKILGEILHKKLLYPQVSPSAISMNKYQLEDRSHVPESDNEEELIATDADNGSKWDKTDSEYIVLEI